MGHKVATSFNMQQGILSAHLFSPASSVDSLLSSQVQVVELWYCHVYMFVCSRKIVSALKDVYVITLDIYHYKTMYSHGVWGKFTPQRDRRL